MTAREYDDLVAGLPRMQHAVFDRIHLGLSNAEIARDLGRSEFTVQNHIKLIFKAFGVQSRSALIAATLRRLGWRPQTMQVFNG